jgi:molybdate transport repressor ModE-like protein
MQVRTKISIVNDQGDPFMGPGIRHLLERIDKYKSINKAAKEMRLSYVKALKMLNRLEKDLGEEILIRTRGGKDQGGTKLTPRGRLYLKAYDRLEKSVHEQADKAFKRFLTATAPGKAK